MFRTTSNAQFIVAIWVMTNLLVDYKIAAVLLNRDSCKCKQTTHTHTLIDTHTYQRRNDQYFPA